MAKISEKKFLNELLSCRDDLLDLIEAECSGFESNPEQSIARQEKALNDFWFFSYTYFPHYIKSMDRSEFHKYIHERLPQIVDDPRGRKDAIAAPRGEGKSTYLTLIFVIWVIFTNRKKFPVIIMDALEQSVLMLQAIKIELEYNSRLKMDFPECVGVGRIWKADTIITANNCMVKVAGSGQKLRGIRFGSHRPDLTILDDLENDDNVRNPEQRKKTESWIHKTVLNLGPPDGTMDTIYIGTILLFDSVLDRIFKKPTWHSKKFSAIVKWPDNMDLWDLWEEILLNNDEDEADKFYQKNKKQMDKGAVVSWPGVRPLVMLMKIRSDDHNSFNSEMQNHPSDEDALFKDLSYWVQVCRHWVLYGSCDPSLGKNNKRGDPSAILVGGYDLEHGILDVIEANIARRVPDMIIFHIINYQIQHSCQAWAFETVQFQEFLRAELVKQSAKNHTPVPAIPVIPNIDKILRIQSIQPAVLNGLIRSHIRHSTLNEQLLNFPNATHDDGPDALQMLYMLATSRAGGSVRITRPSKQTFRQKYRTNFSGYN